jgi:hypothetical protein
MVNGQWSIVEVTHAQERIDFLPQARAGMWKWLSGLTRNSSIPYSVGMM